MSESMLLVLEQCRESLPAALIDGDGYSHLAAVADRLPVDLSTFWGFECRLGEAEARTDILFEVRKQTRGRFLRAGHHPSMLDEMCAQWPAWQYLRKFAEQWADPEHEFSTYIRNIWLEFDTAKVSKHDQIDKVLKHPCIFFGPDVRTIVGKQQAFPIIDDALAVLGFKNTEYSDLEFFMKTLPDDAHVFQVGLMLGRSNPGLRVCLFRLVPEDIADWLSRLNWKGDTKALEELLAKLTPMLDTFALDLNLMNDGPSEKIGLECYMDWQDKDSSQWIPLLDFIAEKNLCLPEKREGVLAYPGADPVPESWKNRYKGVIYLKIFRQIHHIKLSIEHGTLTEAKVYLALNHPGLDLKMMYTKKDDGPWLVQ